MVDSRYVKSKLFFLILLFTYLFNTNIIVFASNEVYNTFNEKISTVADVKSSEEGEASIDINIHERNFVNFAVMSDVHIADDTNIPDNKFIKALIMLNKLQKNLDAIVIAGDLTNSGSELQYDKFISQYNKYSQRTKKLFVMGNHDYWNGLSQLEAQKRFTQKLGVPLNSHELINGIHFIQISTQSGITEGDFEGVRTWLKEELKKAVNSSGSKKPIFVTLHQHIKNTVYGSDLWGNDTLTDILKEYPQVITFSGHSHYPLNDERSIYQKDFTSVGTAALAYIEMEPGKSGGSVPREAYNFSQGLLVSVNTNTNEVKIKKVDFNNELTIKKDWIIKNPSLKQNFIYTDERASKTNLPYFKSSAKINFTNIDKSSVIVNFNQAIDDDMVHSYRIKTINKSTGEIIENLVFSEFYLSPIPNPISYKFESLKSDTEYEFIITAIDSWNNESTDFIANTVKTK